MEKLFWSQYTETEHPMPLSDQLKQLVELHKVPEQAMKGFIVRLWPGNALWSSTNCFSWSLRGVECSAPAYWDQNSFSVELPSSAW